MIKLIEVCEASSASRVKKRYLLREVYVNPKHVVSLREESGYQQKLEEGLLPDGLDVRQHFTRITLDKGHTGLEMVVVGAPHVVEERLQADRRELLHG
jgi:hypothetical protein